jgi:hypothetical protein
MLRTEKLSLINNFTGGLNTKVKELNGMDIKQTPDCMDVYADLDGSLRKRHGRTKLNSTQTGAGSKDGHGLFDFEGTLIGSFGTTYYKMDELDGTWDSLQADMSDETIQCENYQGNLFICNWGGDYIKTMQVGGTSLTSLNTTNVGGRGKHPKVYKDHFIVSGVPGYPYTFFYAENGDIDDFANGGTWPINTHDGDELTGWGELEGRLYPFKRWSIHQAIYRGGSPYWAVQQRASVGTRSPLTIKNVTLKSGEEVVMFLGSDRKLYQFDGSNCNAVSAAFEENNEICPIAMDTLNQGGLAYAHAVVDPVNHWYILFVPNGGTSTITHALAYNYYTGAVWPFAGQVLKSSTSAVDSSGRKWIIAAGYDGYAYRWNYGNTDLGAISTVASAPTAGGTGYTTGDVLTVVGDSGMGGTVSVVAGSGIVTAVTKVTGSGCTISITAVTTATISAYHTTPRMFIDHPVILKEQIQVMTSMKAISDDTVNFYHREDYTNSWSSAVTVPLGNPSGEYYLGTTRRGLALGTGTLGSQKPVVEKTIGLDTNANYVQFKISDSLTTNPWTLYSYNLVGAQIAITRE